MRHRFISPPCQRREVGAGHRRGRAFSLASWYESDRVGRSGRRTDDASAGVKLLFSVTWGENNDSATSFFQSLSWNIFFKRPVWTMIRVNKLVAVLTSKKIYFVVYKDNAEAMEWWHSLVFISWYCQMEKGVTWWFRGRYENSLTRWRSVAVLGLEIQTLKRRSWKWEIHC